MKQENEEKVITAETVIEAALTVVFVLAAIVAVFALIWGRWYAFKVSVSIVVGLLMATVFAYYITDKLSKK